jgi:hypothetical protein
MPYAYEFVKSVESVAAFEGAKQLQISNSWIQVVFVAKLVRPVHKPQRGGKIIAPGANPGLDRKVARSPGRATE